MKKYVKRKISSLLASVLAVVFLFGLLPTVSLPTAAASLAADFEFDESIGMITKYTGSATNVVIPETINGVTVTAIGMEAFSGYTSLTSVSIPGSVTEIGDGAFHSCFSLTSITIPDGVTYIGGGAFHSCFSLTSISFPDSVTVIGVAAFAGCYSLTSITIPGSVTKIGDGAFGGCSSLTSITIPDSVTEIGMATFAACSSLSEIQVAENNPSYCSVDGVLFSKDQKTICCYPAGRSEKSYEIPDGVTYIGDYTFYGCSSLTNITLPGGVTKIVGAWASIMIPDGVMSIDWNAFSGCSSLTSITIPDGVTEIDNVAFDPCSSLSEIRVSENNPVYCSVDGVLFSKDQKTICLYPVGRSEKSYEIPDGVTYIGDYTFYGCSSLTNIAIPDSVVKIGNDAFYSCSSLTSITITNGETEIGDSAFFGCSSLISVTIPDSMAINGDLVFWGCKSLRSFNLRDDSGSIFSLTVLGDKARDFKILYSGTKEEWDSIGIQSDALRKYLTLKVVFISSEVFIWGDVDGNGKVESKDKVLVSRYLAKWTMNGGFNQAAADFNKDGDVTSAEAVVLARYLAKWTNLPYPVGQLA